MLPLPPCVTLEPITWSLKVWVVSWVKRGKLCNPMTLSLFLLMYHALTPTIFFISSNSVGLLFNHSPTKPVNCSPSFLVNCDQNKTTLTTYPWPATKQPAMKRKANTILLACFTLNSWDTSQMVGSHYSYMLWSFSMIWNNFCCCSVAKSYLTLHDPKTAACQASLSLITSWSLPKFMFIASVMPSKHLILLRTRIPPRGLRLHDLL